MPKLNPDEPVQWWDTALTPDKAGREDLPEPPASARQRWHKDNNLAPPGARVARMAAGTIAKRGWTDEEMIAEMIARRMTARQGGAEFGRTGERIGQILRKHGYVRGWVKLGD